MKQFAIALALVMGLTVLPATLPQANAGLPTGIELSFDADSKVLSVNVKHRAKDKAVHYVENITIAINGSKVLSQDFVGQTDESTQMAKYVLLGLTDGATITVSARESIIKGATVMNYTFSGGAFEEIAPKQAAKAANADKGDADKADQAAAN